MTREVDFKQLTQSVEKNEDGAACRLMREFSNAPLQDAIRALNTIQKTNTDDRIEAIKKGEPDLPKITVGNETKLGDDGNAHLKLKLEVPNRFRYERDFNLKDGSSSGFGTGSTIPSCGLDWPEMK